MCNEKDANQAKCESHNKFLELEFTSLRAEILELKARLLRILIAAVSGVPIVMAIGKTMQSDFIFLVAPFISFIAVVLIISEQKGIMRAGRYIRLYIEPQMRPNDKIGWENFLEKDKTQRSHEVGNKIVVLLIFVFYYLFSVITCYDHFKSIEDKSAVFLLFFMQHPFLLIVFYFLFFLLGVCYVCFNFPYSSTKNKDTSKPASPKSEQ